MRLDDIEKAVKLKKELNDTHKLLCGLRDVATAGVARANFSTLSIHNTALVTISEVDESVLLDALEVIKKSLEDKYNRIHAEITAL